MTYIPMQTEQLRDRDIQEAHTLLLRKIETHLSIVTGEELKEEDVNA